MSTLCLSDMGELRDEWLREPRAPAVAAPPPRAPETTVPPIRSLSSLTPAIEAVAA